MAASPNLVSLPTSHGLRISGEARNPTWRVSSKLEVSYEVALKPDLLDPGEPALAEAGAPAAGDTARRLLVVDSTVHALYGTRIDAYFTARGVEHEFCVLDVHESVKRMETVYEIVTSMDAFQVPRRREPVIAIGGGVLTDLVGLATSLYRRSTPYVRVPTSLICMVDAGIGAKTGVNFGRHKNRLGTYHPSAATLIDPGFLATLAPQHIRNGLAEILKIALMKDADLFDLLAAHGPRLVEERMQPVAATDSGAAASTMMRLAIHGMLAELQPNLWEKDLQRLVDFGHSFSPTIEMAALPELLHGEAVCVDMALSAVLARRRGLLDRNSLERVLGVMNALRLPLLHRVCTPELIHGALADTVKHRDSRQRLPLPAGIGDACFVDDVTTEELTAALAELREIDGNTPRSATTSGSRGE